MSSGGPDLFVVCKSCRSEVSRTSRSAPTAAPGCASARRSSIAEGARASRRPPRRRRRAPRSAACGRARSPGSAPTGRPVVDATIAGDHQPAWCCSSRGARTSSTSPTTRSSGKLGDELVARADRAVRLLEHGLRLRRAVRRSRSSGCCSSAATATRSSLGVLLLARRGRDARRRRDRDRCPSRSAPTAPRSACSSPGRSPPLQELRAGEEPEADLIGAAVFAAVLARAARRSCHEADWIVGLVGALLGLRRAAARAVRAALGVLGSERG